MTLRPRLTPNKPAQNATFTAQQLQWLEGKVYSGKLHLLHAAQSSTFSYKGYANHRGWPAGTVKSRLARAREAANKALGIAKPKAQQTQGAADASA